MRRLRKEAGAPVLELPMLFEPEVGLAEYEHLAEELMAELRANVNCAGRSGCERRGGHECRGATCQSAWWPR